MDRATKDILSINKIKRDAQKKRTGINRKPGESLAAFVTRAQKHKEKMQKEEVEVYEASGGYTPSAEKSKFNSGYRAHLKNPQGKTSYLSQHSFKKKDDAVAHAKAYHNHVNVQKRNPDRFPKPDRSKLVESFITEDSWEEIPMMKRQLRYIQIASRDIMEYISQCDDQCVDPEEWFQNKLSHIHGQMQSLHAYVEGAPDMEDSGYDMEESYDIFEELKVSDGIESWIKDFYKSDAPQFKGKDKKERRDMAVAAYLSAKRKKEG